MFKPLKSFEQVLNYAIDREASARLFYLFLAEHAENKPLRILWERLADEELEHQRKLIAVKQGRYKKLKGKEEFPDLGIADHAPEVKPHHNMSIEEALLLAMHKEKAAYRFYLDMAATTDTETLADLFLALAHEEANHKVRLEIEYDDLILNVQEEELGDADE